MVVVHARNAWLKGLSPKENREVPPLKYDWAYRLKQERPALPVVLNGGLASIEAVQAQAAHVDGVMLGRAAYHDPCCISWRLQTGAPLQSRGDLLRALRPRGSAAGRGPGAEAHLPICSACSTASPVAAHSARC